MEKTIKVIGGVGDKWGNVQYRQQFRVIDSKQLSYALNSSGIPILTIRTWKRKHITQCQTELVEL